MKKNIVHALLTAAVLLFTPLAQAEGFNPDVLIGVPVDKVTKCGSFACQYLTIGEKMYVRVVDDDNQAKYVYLVIRTGEKPGEKPEVAVVWSYDAI